MALNKQHKLYQEDLTNILSVKGIEQLHHKCFLITGATGLLGMQLIDALMAMGDVNVVAVRRSKAKAQERLGEYFDSPRFQFLEHDVTLPLLQILPSISSLDYIIPLASYTHPMAYSQYPIETLFINIKGAEYALELAEQCGAIVLYPSTVEIYGNAYGDDIFTEDYTGRLNLANARSCYPESKRTCEALCQSFLKERGIQVKIVRLSRVFGPTMLPSDTKASSQFIQNAIAGDDIVLKKVEPIVQMVAKASEKGLNEDGSMVHEANLDTGYIDTDRHWWVQAENVVGWINIYQYFGDEDALQKALNGWQYIKDNLIDREGGEWWWSRDPQRNINRKDDKAGFWKCPYHNSRMCLEILERDF